MLYYTSKHQPHEHEHYLYMNHLCFCKKIFHCHRKEAEILREGLAQHLPCAFYHGDLTAESRRKAPSVLKWFHSGDTPPLDVYFCWGKMGEIPCHVRLTLPWVTAINDSDGMHTDRVEAKVALPFMNFHAILSVSFHIISWYIYIW